MSFWGFISLAFVLVVVAMCAWALWHQRRMFPPGSERIGEPDERKRGLRWIGFIYGGGRG